MSNLEIQETKGICTVCAGHSGGVCYCQCLFIDSDSHHHESISTSEETSPEPKSIHQHYQRKKKDNTAPKRFSTILKNIYTKLAGKEIKADVLKEYSRKDYFVMILNLVEKEDLLEETSKIFHLQLEKMMTTIQVKFKTKGNREEELKHLNQLAKDHLKALELFIGGEVKETLKALYHSEQMKQKGNFKKSLKKIEEMRKEMGLSF